jgi:hypothetical protein
VSCKLEGGRRHWQNAHSDFAVLLRYIRRDSFRLTAVSSALCLRHCIRRRSVGALVWSIFRVTDGIDLFAEFRPSAAHRGWESLDICSLHLDLYPCGLAHLMRVSGL